MREPVEVEERQDEVAAARVAAVDVAKASGVVPPGGTLNFVVCPSDAEVPQCLKD
jgi:hypothetical protein